VPPMHQPAAIAIIDHPDLGTLRAVGSFRPEERELFEAQFACWSMRCIYYGDDRYLLGSEYDGSGGCHDEWDEAAIQSQYAKDANHFDLRDLKQAETAALDQFAHIQAKTLERHFASMLSIDLADNLFAHTIRTADFWRAAAVVASRPGTSEHFVALGLSTKRFENALSHGAAFENEQADFHRALLRMASSGLAEKFDQVWPHCRVSLRKGSEPATSIAIIRRLHKVLGGSRGEPYGSDNPVLAMGDYLRHCQI
jgi:hypothetical protein